MRVNCGSSLQVPWENVKYLMLMVIMYFSIGQMLIEIRVDRDQIQVLYH